MAKEDRGIVHHVLHDEIHETIRRITAGVRVTMAHSKTVIYRATIPTKITITAAMDGAMTRKVNTRKAKVTGVHPRSQTQEDDQAPIVTGDIMTMGAAETTAVTAPTTGGMQKNTVAVTMNLGGKMEMCMGTKRRGRGRRRRIRSAGRLNWKRI
jgi:hypothetical protein